MLPKSRKLRGKDAFSGISKGARRFSGRYFNLALKQTLGPSRFACVVSLRVSKKAVVRNKIRRRCFSVIGSHLARINKGYEAALFFKPGADAAAFAELEQDIKSVFSGAGILR